MDINGLLEILTVEEFMPIFESGVVFGCLMLFAFDFIGFLIRLLDNVFFSKRNTAFCLGLHNGSIEGVCRNRSCPHAGGCVYFLPPITLRDKIRTRFRALIRRFKY